ncbi:hypothetical protein GCM10025794_06270 [Massilia kyonggiensis]|jgi:hypothetical protein
MVSAETVARLMGMLQGIIVMICANDVPKRLPPVERLYCDPAHDLAYRRSIGWMLVVAGFGFTLAFAFAPLPIARHVAIGILALPVFVVVCMMAYVVWRRFSNRRSAS